MWILWPGNNSVFLNLFCLFKECSHNWAVLLRDKLCHHVLSLQTCSGSLASEDCELWILTGREGGMDEAWKQPWVKDLCSGEEWYLGKPQGLMSSTESCRINLEVGPAVYFPSLIYFEVLLTHCSQMQDRVTASIRGRRPRRRPSCCQELVSTYLVSWPVNQNAWTCLLIGTHSSANCCQ